MSDNQNHEQKFVPPPLPPRDSNASSELTSQENANTVVPDSAECSTPNTPKSQKHTPLIAVLAVICILVVGALLLPQKLAVPGNGKEESVNLNIGVIGNKIIVDGRVAYVAGENKILVPYGFCGNFSECSSVVYGVSLKGCENPRLPADETDDLPEETAREIISFYGDIGGFWTSIEADHATIEIVGNEPESLHYAGIMDNYFSVGSDGVADAAWGYCLDATNDTTPMGLLVLYDVIVDKLEFENHKIMSDYCSP